MANENATPVVVENGPVTQAATAAAVVANTAATQAAQTAQELATQAQREAEERTAEIAAETGAALRQQEDQLQWLRDHARTQETRSEALATGLTEQAREVSTIREAVTGLGTLLQSLASKLSTQASSPEAGTPEAVNPSEEGAVRPAQETTQKRRRRLI